MNSFTKQDIISYLVDCLCHSREEAEQMTNEQSFEEYLHAYPLTA